MDIEVRQTGVESTVTNLERLIKGHVEAATVATLSGATERIAEEIARELLKDETFRAEMHALVRKHFGAQCRHWPRTAADAQGRASAEPARAPACGRKP